MRGYGGMLSSVYDGDATQAAGFVDPSQAVFDRSESGRLEDLIEDLRQALG